MTARAILIPEHSADPITEVVIGMEDGGLADVARQLGTFDLEDEYYSDRRDAVILFQSVGERNNRATRLLDRGGIAIYGDALVIGQLEDGGMQALPEDITLELLTARAVVR